MVCSVNGAKSGPKPPAHDRKAQGPAPFAHEPLGEDGLRQGLADAEAADGGQHSIKEVVFPETVHPLEGDQRDADEDGAAEHERPRPVLGVTPGTDDGRKEAGDCGVDGQGAEEGSA